MEFTTRSYKRNFRDSVGDNRFWIFTLLGVIFLLLAYLIQGFNASSWVYGALIILAIGFIYLARFVNAFEKEKVLGEFDKEISITEDGLRIDKTILSFDDIESIRIQIDKYEGQMKADFHKVYKSAGLSNTITVVTNQSSYSETFHLRDVKHKQNLMLVVYELRKSGVNIELNS